MSRTVARLFILAALLLVNVFALVLAQPGGRQPQQRSLPAQVHGQVRFASGARPAEHVLVRLDRTDGGVAGEVTTDRTGKFRFVNLLPAQYVVTVRAPGFRDAQQRIDLLTSSSEYVQFQLVVDDSAAAPPTAPAGTVSAAGVPAEARREFEEGRALLLGDARKEKLDAGVKHLEKAVALYPDFAEAHLLLGTGYMDLKQLDRAEKSLRRALALTPKSAAALFALGELHRQRKQYEEAERVLAEGLAIDDKSAQGHFTLGRVYFERNDIARAGPSIGRALRLKPDFAEAHLVAGNILLRARQAENALAEYEEYLRLAPAGEFAAQAREMARKIREALAEKK